MISGNIGVRRFSKAVDIGMVIFSLYNLCDEFFEKCSCLLWFVKRPAANC